MKTDDPLDQLLSEWRVRADVPPEFRREVWQTISSRCAEPTWIEKLSWWLLQPNRKIFALAVAVMGGVILDFSLPARDELSPHDAYVMSISPFDPHHPNRRF